MWGVGGRRDPEGGGVQTTLGVPGRSPRASLAPRCGALASSGASLSLDAFQDARRALQDGPRSLQDAPRSFQDAVLGAHNGPKGLQIERFLRSYVKFAWTLQNITIYLIFPYISMNFH